MPDDSIRLRVDGLTELDRLELQKLVPADALETGAEARPAGRLGEPGSLFAVVTISLATIDVIGLALVVWLSRGGRRTELKDHIVIESSQGRIERKLVFSSNAHDEIKQQLMKQLGEALPAPRSAGADDRGETG